MPSFNGPKVEYISSLNEVNYPGPYMVMTDGRQPTAKEIGNFNGKIYVLRGVATEQDFAAIADKLDDQYAQNNPKFAAYLKERRAKEALKKGSHPKKEEVKRAVEPRTEPKIVPKVEPKIVPKVEPKIVPKVEPKVVPKSEPKKPLESGDHAPNAGESSKGSMVDLSAPLKTGKELAPDIAYTLGSAEFDPEFPDRAVVLKGKFYLLHKDAKEQDITELAEKLAEVDNGIRERPSDRKWIEAALGRAIDKLGSMASAVTDVEAQPHLSQHIPPHARSLSVLRCSVPWVPEQEKVKSNEELAANLSKMLMTLVPVHGTPQFDHPTQLDIRAKAYTLHPNSRKEDIDAFTTKFIAYTTTFPDNFFHGPAKEPEWSGVMEKLAVFTNEVVDPVKVDWVAFGSDDVSGHAYQAIREKWWSENNELKTADSGKAEPEKVADSSVDSNEDDEYEEVGNFSDIKCKCVIS